MRFDDALYGTAKNGVITLAGYVASVTVEHGSLLIKDGLKGNVVERRFSRAACPITRLISTQSEGYISFGAVRWLHEIGASTVHLNYDGTPLLVSAPTGYLRDKSVLSSLTGAATRRKQASLSFDSEPGNSIARALIKAKIEGQITVLKQFGFNEQADVASSYTAAKLTEITSRSDSIPLLSLEGNISIIYWKSLADTRLKFARYQQVPKHWHAFGTRQSLITSRPRGATSPGNALANYLYGILASEIAIATYAAGLDPELGILHTDKADRASLAYDLMEPIRPIVDSWLFQWLQSMTFNKRDFYEDRQGKITIARPLTAHLAMTAPLWRSLAEPAVSWFYKILGSSKQSAPKSSRSRARPNAITIPGFTIHSETIASVTIPSIAMPKTCAECGRVLTRRRGTFCSKTCLFSHNRATTGTAAPALAKYRASGGPNLSPSPAASEKRRSTNRSHALARYSLKLSPAQRAALNHWYAENAAPEIARFSNAQIRHATGLSSRYATLIRYGIPPHPIHFSALARLIGIVPPESLPLSTAAEMPHADLPEPMMLRA